MLLSLAVRYATLRSTPFSAARNAAKHSALAPNLPGAAAAPYDIEMREMDGRDSARFGAIRRTGGPGTL